MTFKSLINDLSIFYEMTLEMTYLWLKWLIKWLINELCMTDEVTHQWHKWLKNDLSVNEITYHLFTQKINSDLNDLQSELPMTYVYSYKWLNRLSKILRNDYSISYVITYNMTYEMTYQWL